VKVRVTLDKTGRIVIPKQLREELRLEPGDVLVIESAGGRITLVHGTEPLTKEQDVWVLRTGHPLPASSTDAVLQQGARNATGRIKAKPDDTVAGTVTAHVRKSFYGRRNRGAYCRGRDVL
jgi:AbrB family looped-hinge helix DNA binding protein